MKIYLDRFVHLEFIPRITSLLLLFLVPISINAMEITAMHTSPAEVDEMQRMLRLVRDEDATHVSVQSGAWSKGSTWNTGTAPESGARVVISADHAVVVKTKIPHTMMTVRVDGILRFKWQKRSTELRVDTMVVNAGGTLKMGTQNLPIAANVTAKLVIDDLNNGFITEDPSHPDYDPLKLGNGLISHGRIEMHGAVKTEYATMDSAYAGDIELVLDEAPVGWRVGDKLIIAGTSTDTLGDEVAHITAIQGTTVTLDTPLIHDHYTPAHSKPGLTLKVHVANGTRNVIVETAEDDRESLDSRGHTLFMHTNDVAVRYAAFNHLGRTNKLKYPNDTKVNFDTGEILSIGTNPRARYPVHFHRSGTTGSPGLIASSVVFNSPGWGYVNHSGHAEMVRNIAYDISGAAFACEAGNEQGSFIENLSIRTQGLGRGGVTSWDDRDKAGVRDFGFHGHGFWFTGVYVNVVGNIVNGASNTAYAFGSPPLDGVTSVTLDNGSERAPRQAPIKLFVDNQAYGSAVTFGIWGGDGSYRIHNTLAWRMEPGSPQTHVRYTHFLHQYGTTLISDAPNQPGIGIGTHSKAEITRLDNAHVEGFGLGVDLGTWGINAYSQVVVGGFFENKTDFRYVHGDTQVLLGGTRVYGPVKFGVSSSNKLNMTTRRSNKNVAQRYYTEFKLLWDIEGESAKRMYLDNQQRDSYVPVISNPNGYTNVQRVQNGLPPVANAIWPDTAIAPCRYEQCPHHRLHRKL